MSEHDAVPDDGPEHRSLGTALADLAATMPDDPYRLDGVHAKARRLRHRRRAARATAGVVTAAAVVAALVAVRPGATSLSTIPASAPTTSPSCAAALANAPGPDTTGADDAKKAAAADASNSGGTVANESARASEFRGVKGLGTIVSATDAAVTVTLDDPVGGQPVDVTATIGPSAEFVDGDTPVGALPPLSPGDEVGFAASHAGDGSYELMYLGVHVPERPKPVPETIDPAVKAARDGMADTDAVKVTAEVVSVQAGSMTLHVTDGDLAARDITVAVGPATLYTTVDQKCVDPVLPAGQAVGAVLVPAADGSYTALEVALFPASGAVSP
jgi:hypothetical protein